MKPTEFNEIGYGFNLVKKHYMESGKKLLLEMAWTLHCSNKPKVGMSHNTAWNDQIRQN